MSAVLDAPVFAGDVVVAALIERSVTHFGHAQRLSARGSKRPVAILLRTAGSTIAFDIAGARLDLDAFEQRHPGQRATFEGLADGLLGAPTIF